MTDLRTLRPPRNQVPLHDLEVPAPGVLPFALGSFDTIGPLSRAAFPHRHSFHEVVYVTEGRGTHVLDLVEWPLEPPQLWVLLPGQVHHWAGAHGLDGWVLLFNEDFLLRHPEDAGLLRVLAGRPWLRPDRAQDRAITGLFGEMLREHQAGEPGFPGVLQAYLHVLLVRALRASAPAPSGRPVAPRAAELADRFGRLIADPDRADRTVGSFARELGVSTGRLHELVKEATGRTPALLIRRQQILEAKRLLVATELTVREVAAGAGFPDPSYFCRFFRREVGLTPGEFRARAGGNHHDPGARSIDGCPAEPVPS
ncbi:AraC family transcriptional regulator [Kitasatospora sp. MBT63]|uniref:helix-turn-helix transcriptional regulator n=1 Tax=Kitasatospora sp. MBT63 TaxID=1444768 RepID=UPI001E4F5778|nr:AraC family transcriptional regulator [Kitasatospora sp. MBT63]